MSMITRRRTRIARDITILSLQKLCHRDAINELVSLHRSTTNLKTKRDIENQINIVRDKLDRLEGRKQR